MSEADRQAFTAVPETCPVIDKGAEEFEKEVARSVHDHLYDFVEKVVKQRTVALRDALIEALGEKIDLERRVETLTDTIDDLKKDIALLERELAQ